MFLKGHTHKSKHRYRPEKLYRRFVLSFFLTLLMTGFTTSSFGQNACNYIKLKAGTGQITNCFIRTIPVWIEYDNPADPNPPSSFTICNDPATGGYDIIIEGVTGNGEVNDVYKNDNLPDQAFVDIITYPVDDPDFFKIQTDFGTNNTLTMGFGSESEPHFYIEVFSEPDEDFTIDLSFPFSFRLIDDCPTGGSCTPETPDPAISYSGPVENNAPCEAISTSSTPLDFEYFFDTGNMIYEAGATQAKLPLKLRTNNPGFINDVLKLHRLGFSFTWVDLYNNLDIFVPEQGEQYWETEVSTNAQFTNKTNSGEVTVDIKTTSNTNDPNDVFEVPFDANGEALLFYVIMNTPSAPLMGGEATFSFGYQRLLVGSPYFTGNEEVCCIFEPAPNTDVVLDNYNAPCTNVDWDGTIHIGDAVSQECANAIEIPVSLQSYSPTIGFTITDIQIVVDLELLGNLQIDQTATINSLNVSNASLSVNQNEITLSAANIFFAPDFQTTNPWPLFDIILEFV